MRLRRGGERREEGNQQEGLVHEAESFAWKSMVKEDASPISSTRYLDSGSMTTGLPGLSHTQLKTVPCKEEEGQGRTGGEGHQMLSQCMTDGRRS